MSEWIEWRGGEMPVDEIEKVDLKLRGGGSRKTQIAGRWLWSHHGNAGDIIHYRVCEDNQMSEKGILSNKAKDWKSFQLYVAYHIETYVVPQYGDKGDDPASDYSIPDLMRQIEKYAKRQGKNAREGQDALDLIKIAHYAQMAHTKLKEKA